MDNLNWKSEVNLELFGSIYFSRAGAGAFQLQFFFAELELELLDSIFCSELELEPQWTGGDQVGASSKLEPIVHLCCSGGGGILDYLTEVGVVVFWIISL